jgi:hypothetical protein
MKRTEKLLYVPGLISLIGLLVAIPSFYKKVIPIKEYCLTLYIPTDCKKDRPTGAEFSSCYIERIISKKKKLQFTLNENEDENKIKISVIRYEALKLKYTKDTSTVILITLSDSISYGEVISLYDLCEYDKHKRYASWDNKFVIFGEWPEKKKELPEIQLMRCGYEQLEKRIIKPTFIEQVKQRISEYYSLKASYLLAGWIALFISFLYFRKRRLILKKN